MSCTTQTASSLADRWPLSEIIHMHVPCILAVADVWGWPVFISLRASDYGAITWGLHLKYGKCYGLAQTWYRIAENFRGRKLSRIGEKYNFLWRKLSQNFENRESFLHRKLHVCYMWYTSSSLLLLAGETASWCAKVCQDWEAWLQRYVRQLASFSDFPRFTLYGLTIIWWIFCHMYNVR